MKDKWCKKLKLENGKSISGGAARNVRIAAAGGMDNILYEVAHEAATLALHRADEILNPPKKMRLVK